MGTTCRITRFDSHTLKFSTVAGSTVLKVVASIGSAKVLLDFRRLGFPISTLDADMKTRDFTVNAIYYNPLTQEIIDKCGGIDHLVAKELHVVTDLN